jgi:hypothetical protein
MSLLWSLRKFPLFSVILNKVMRALSTANLVRQPSWRVWRPYCRYHGLDIGLNQLWSMVWTMRCVLRVVDTVDPHTPQHVLSVILNCAGDVCGTVPVVQTCREARAGSETEQIEPNQFFTYLNVNSEK